MLFDSPYYGCVKHQFWFSISFALGVQNGIATESYRIVSYCIVERNFIFHSMDMCIDKTKMKCKPKNDGEIGGSMGKNEH